MVTGFQMPTGYHFPKHLDSAIRWRSEMRKDLEIQMPRATD